MTLLAFGLATLALLLAPGPTNTLMAVAGASHGLARVLRLLPAELAGYLTTVLPLALVGAELLHHAPLLSLALKLVAALWVIRLAVKLWQVPPDDGSAFRIGRGRIFTTTLLNPKALVFGLVLLPTPDPVQLGLRLALFLALVSLAALVWGGLGALTRASRGGAGPSAGLRRLAALWLGFVAVSLVWGALHG